MMDSKKHRRSERLLEWYQGQSSHRLDLIGDFAGKELFAIDANSLLLHCVVRAHVDFTDGFQLLHAVYAVEILLRRLHDRGCNFHLVFFREYEEMSIPPGTSKDNATKYLLTSQILFHHLKHQDLDDQETFVYEFPRPDVPVFGEYLKANDVRCFVGLDGSVGDGANFQAQARYVHVLYQALRLDVKVAVLNDLKICNNKIFANVISPALHGSPVFNIKHPEYKSLVVPGASPVDDELEARLEAYSVREKISTAVACKLLSKDSPPGIKLKVVALILHLVGMRHWALTDRNCNVSQVKTAGLLDEFFYRVRVILASCSPTSWVFQGAWDLFDLFDGRVFLNVYTGVRDKKAFPEIIVTETRSLLRVIEDFTKAKLLCHLPPVMRASEVESDASDPSSHQYLMLPFSQPVFDQYLPVVDLGIDESHIDSEFNQIFEELWHWHNGTSRLEHRHNPKPLRFFAHRRNQQFMANTIVYSASLTNSTGKIIDPEIIVVQQDHDSKSSSKVHPNAAKKAPTKTKKHTAVSGRQRALEAAKAIQDRKEQTKACSVLSGWTLWCRDLDEEKSLTKRYQLALRYLGGLRKQDFDVVGPEVLLYICDILCQIWIELAQRKVDQNVTVMRIAGLIYQHSTAIARMPRCTMEISNAVKLFAKLLRLSDIPMAESTNPSRSLPFKVCSLEGLLLPIAAVEFQLQCCGPYLERSFDSREDERVSFSPDAWQRDVLDAIDAEKSLLVIAPTSAGKTFISFYAMKKVLQSDDDRVIVYVAPTKALVNQIAAEVQARFSKTFRHKDGRSVWAIHTRDYRVNNPTGCQILVTVPHILQIMLLSPSNAKGDSSWSHRVKCIIFDEVHCIGQSEEGVVWEQLILMAPCPIIALSATVGNPDAFYEWLKVTQEQHDRSLCMVKHDSRYSDLRKFAYAKPRTFKFTGLKSMERLPTPGLQDIDNEESAFRHIHPAAVLRTGDRHAMDDISLEPQDCLTLWKAMANAKAKGFQSLDPRKAFSGLLSKTEVVQWEKQLKKKYRHLMASDEACFHKIRSELLKTPTHSQTREDPFKQDEDPKLLIGKYQKQDHTIALPLLCDLHSHDGLPAILFNHERYECERALQNVLQELQSSEADYKKSNPEWKEQMKQYKLWKQRRAAKISAVKDSESKKKKKTLKLTKDGRLRDGPAKALEEEKLRELEAINLSRWASFDPSAPLDEFSFADKTKLGSSEFEEMLKPLEGQHVPSYFIDGLRRGLGVHHAGMNRRYRQTVEILFRKGYLRAVIATGTLALGINMPCKTVVFVGDSIFHTALNYRQASGRAGRRGFDLLGNVVFAGIKPQRVFEIMSSKLPDLRGQFALSTTLILRALGLLHATDNTPYSANIAKGLLTQNRLFLGGPESKMFVQHHLRFSIEYLRRQHLLSKKGAPINFAGLVGHLYYTENAAFAFHALLKEGYFHKLCADIYSKRDKVLEELALVMAHLFLRVQCTNAVKMSINEGIVSSYIQLPNLPARAEEILREHNRQILSIFISYAATFARMHLKDVPDRVLPYTQHAVGPEKPVSLGGLDKLPPCFLRSPFAALSGHDDRFSSTQDLCSNVRAGVFMEESAIPSLAIAPHDTGGPLNGYLFNFYKHGDLTALSEDNKIRKGSVYNILKDFTFILSTIVASLKNYTNIDVVVDDEDIMGVYDDEKGSDDEGGDANKAGSSSLPCWAGANAEHGTLEHVQKAFAMLLEDYDNKLWKHAS